MLKFINLIPLDATIISNLKHHFFNKVKYRLCITNYVVHLQGIFTLSTLVIHSQFIWFQIFAQK